MAYSLLEIVPGPDLMAPVATADATRDFLATKLDGLADGNLGQGLRQLLQKEITLDDLDFPGIFKDHTVQFRLAPHFGKLDEKSMQKMDKALSVMTYYTIRDLGTGVRGGGELTWETVIAKLTNNLCLETSPDCPSTSRAKIFPIDQRKYSALQNRELKAWFRELVNDVDVVEATPISMDEVQESVHTAPELEARRIFLDVGILRYPDIFHPYIQVYHIQLFVRKEAPRGGSIRDWIRRRRDVHWIQGEYNSCKFKPRNEMIKQIDPDLMDQAVANMNGTLRRLIGAGGMSVST